MIWKRLAGVVAILVAGILAWRWAGNRPADGPPGAGPGPTQAGGRRGGPPGTAVVPVTPGIVAKQDVPIFLDGLGTVQAFNSVTVRARVDGEIKQVAFTEGQDVKAGDLLVLIDPRPYQAQLDQALAKKGQDEALLANAKVTLARNTELMLKNVLDRQTFDTSRYAVDQLGASVQADEAAVQTARIQFDYTRVTAPIEGRVGVRLVDTGNVVRASDQTGVVVINQVHPISVTFTLPAQYLPSIQLQLRQQGAPPMQVLALDRDNRSPLGDGLLAVVDNQIDPSTGTIKLKATFTNDQLSLWPGQFVNTRLLLKTIKEGIVVPASVVQRGPQGPYAYVIKADQTAELRPIKVSQIESGLALIDEGLTPGEKVVVDGQYKLQPGGKVDDSSVPRGNRPPGAPAEAGKPADGRTPAAGKDATPGDSPKPRRDGSAPRGAGIPSA